MWPFNRKPKEPIGGIYSSYDEVLEIVKRVTMPHRHLKKQALRTQRTLNMRCMFTPKPIKGSREFFTAYFNALEKSGAIGGHNLVESPGKCNFVIELFKFRDARDTIVVKGKIQKTLKDNRPMGIIFEIQFV